LAHADHRQQEKKSRSTHFRLRARETPILGAPTVLLRICVRVLCQIFLVVSAAVLLSDFRPVSHFSFTQPKYQRFEIPLGFSCVPLLRAKGETVWLARLAKSSHEATTDGSYALIRTAIAKTKKRNYHSQRSMVACAKRKHI
jgi:hypothetical protein